VNAGGRGYEQTVNRARGHGDRAGRAVGHAGAVSERSPTLEMTDRTTLRRKRERGDYDRAAAYAILDEAVVCHVGFTLDGTPHIVPMAYARVGDDLYLHGAAGNRMLRQVATGVPVCVTVTLVDGVVLARTAFHHSLNYRCVVLYGTATRVRDAEEIDRATAALLEHMAPGRSADARMPTEAERRKTLFVRLPIAEGSVKVRSGPPLDDPEDLEMDVWAGVIPLALAAGAAQPDPTLPPGVAMPPYAADYPERGPRA
jgi:nitroimidazol reductase NimA-like FMN-containing flavoprotein (pyridoxamine 5'-phosphate oxidase superfamily)